MLAILGPLVCLVDAVVVLIGWHFRIPSLKTIPGQITVVSANAAGCFILCSLAVLLLRDRKPAWRAWPGRILASVVFLFSVLTLLEYLFGFDFRIDGLFFHHRLSDWPVPTVPGRFAIQSAISFTCVSAAILFVDRRVRSLYLSEILAGASLIPILVAVLGFFYKSSAMHGVIAVQTVLLFCILIVGVLLMRSQDGAIALLLSKGSAGVASRGLIFTTCLLLAIFGWVSIKLEYSGLVNLEIGTALLVTLAMIAVTLLILGTARRLDALDHRREAATAELARALREKQSSEDRLIEGLETAKAAIWDFDFHSGELYWSSSHFSLLGYGPLEVKPSMEAWLNRLHPEDAPVIAKLWKDCIRNKEPFTCQYRVVWPDESVHWMESKGKITYDESGKPIRSIGGFVDITERKHSQQALMQAEKLAAAGRMAATLAHEINNPLAAITNLIFLLKAKSNKLELEDRQYLELADQEIKRVSQIVQKTLTFYRMDVAPSAVRPGELVRDLTWLYQKRIRDLSIDVRVEDTVTEAITFNAGEVRQVLTNIFVNAIDAAGEHGAIIVRVRPASGGNSNGRKGVRVLIADNGPGIPVEHQRLLFTPFFSSKKDRGTGLGLWISKGLIERNGGSLRFRTRNGKMSGTCFSIFIPDATPEKLQANSISA